MSNSAEQLLYRALTLLEQEKLDEAITELEEAIEVASYSRREVELIRAHTLLGELLASTGELADAKEHFQEAMLAAETFTGDRSNIDEEIDVCREGLEQLRLMQDEDTPEV